jgi:hypothetical protein
MRGERTPSVSCDCSRFVIKEENADFAGLMDVGVLGIVDEGDEVGFEMYAAWTDECVAMLDKGTDPPDCWRVRNGGTKLRD